MKPTAVTQSTLILLLISPEGNQVIIAGISKTLWGTIKDPGINQGQMRNLLWYLLYI